MTVVDGYDSRVNAFKDRYFYKFHITWNTLPLISPVQVNTPLIALLN